MKFLPIFAILAASNDAIFQPIASVLAIGAKSREIPRKFELIALQGHPKSCTLVPIESA